MKPEHEIHNMLLDLEIDAANRYNKMVDEQNKAALKSPYLNMEAPKIVCRIRYVE